MRQVPTVCPRDCYDTCALIVTVSDGGEVHSVKGDPSHPVTQGLTCPRAAKDHERLYKNRVEAPFLREGEDFVPAGWEKSLYLVSKKLGEVLKKYGSDAVLYLDYAGNTGLLTTVFTRRLWNCIGATQTDWGLCSTSGHKALTLHHGESYGAKPVELLEMNLIVFWGFNASVSSPHMWALARKARRERGTRIVVVDPVESDTARGADLWIQPMPGSDVALAYGIIRHLIENNHVDTEFIENWTTGFDELKAEAAKWTPDKVEQTTGVPAKLVGQLAGTYGSSEPSTTMIGIGLQKCDRGADQVRAVSFIPALLGLHRGFYYSNGHSFLVDEPLISGLALTENTPKVVEQVALPDLINSGRFKFVYVSCMNPAVTLPNQHALRQGLSRDDVFVVLHETHWTKTAQYADVILPAPTFLEKEDLVIPWGHSYVRYSEAAVSPVTDSRSEVMVMREIARRVGLTEDWLYENPWRAVEQGLAGAVQNAGFESLRSGELLELATKPKDDYPTTSGKIEFRSSMAEKLGLDPLPVQATLDTENEKLVLLTSATPKFTSTQFQEVYGAIPAVVTVSSADAERLRLKKGDTVTLANERGKVKATVSISESLPRGVAWAPRQFEDAAGEPQNCLASSIPQEIGSGPRFNSTTVSITKI